MSLWSTRMSTDGKNLENDLKQSFKYICRMYDTKTAMGGGIPAQPADFVVPKYFVECKDTELGDHYLKKNFSQSQIAKQKIAEFYGVPTYYYLNFRKLRKKVIVKAEVIYTFMNTKGKGKLFYEDVEPFIVEWLTERKK